MKKIEVDAGPHSVVCRQNEVRYWSRQVTVGAGQTVEARGSVLGAITVTFAVDASIDGTPFRAGHTAQLAAGRRRVEIGGADAWVSLSRPCQVRATPEIGCY